MKALWKLTCRLTGRKPIETKRKRFLLLNCAASGLAGFAIWLIVRCFALDSLDWMACFIGYPAAFYGLIGGLIYLMDLNDRLEE